MVLHKRSNFLGRFPEIAEEPMSMNQMMLESKAFTIQFVSQILNMFPRIQVDMDKVSANMGAEHLGVADLKIKALVELI